MDTQDQTHSSHSSSNGNQLNTEQRNLLSATQKGDASAIRKVLHGHQVNPDAKIRNAGEERSPLHIASGYGQDAVVAELLKAGADPCAVSSSGRTPLHDACQGGHLECVELIADFDVDLDSQDKDGMAPIHIAAFQGELKCLKALAEKGADLTIINAKGQEPIHLAVMRNHVDIVKYMFERSVNLESQCFQGKQPLHYAAQHGALESLIALIERNCDIDIGDNNGCVPAHLAAKMDKVDCLRFLAKQGSTLDMTQGEGKSYAHMAAQNGSSKCLHWLLEKGVDPNVKDGYGNTAGHCAAEKGHAECFNCYVQHRGNLDILNDKNETPVQSGRRYGAPVKLQKAACGELQCPQCIAKNKRLDWELAHRPSAVETGIMHSGRVAYTNPVSADKSMKTRKLEPPMPGSAKGRASQASNVSNLFLTQNYMPVRDMTTKFYGQHLGSSSK